MGAMFLEVDTLTKRFGGLVAVSGVSLQIEEGEIVGILGPNGSGKTTLLNLLAGLLVPTSGSVIWQGRDISGSKPETIASLGLVKTFQNPQLFAELSVLEHVMIASHLALKRLLGFGRYKTFFSSRVSDGELQIRADRVMKLCRLDGVKEKPAAALSYGEEKMLGVAMAMMCEPKLLLLDEPASGLGQEEIANLGLVLRDLREHGTTLCVIDHKVAFLAQFAKRLIVLQNGSKIVEGAPGEVLSNQSVITAYLGRQHVGA
jgi:ABC-type branched-subunit amino acid transport system ATPase component